MTGTTLSWRVYAIFGRPTQSCRRGVSGRRRQYSRSGHPVQGEQEYRVSWLKLHEETGGLKPRKGKKGRPSPLVGEVADLLIRLAVDDPDASRQLLCDRLEALTAVKSSLSAIGRFLKKNGLTYKKRRSMQQNRSKSVLSGDERLTSQLPKDLRPKTSSSSMRPAPTLP